jgi:lipid-A-disaccharide synthase-like uncharacterized protein/quercetin dioxygenase-like cupin family protein
MTDGSFLEPILGETLPWLYVDTVAWTVVGLSGNAMFSSRFLYQWLHSERRKQLLVPPAFWYLSFWGSAISLLYALHIDKLPVILGYCFLPILYARNIALLKKGNGEAAEETESAEATPSVVSLDEEFAQIEEPWQPRAVARVQDVEVKLTRLDGEFIWHKHDREDELFLVQRGKLRIELRDGALDLGPGELTVIPRGMDHRPVAEKGTEVVLIEQVGTVKTGDA